MSDFQIRRDQRQRLLQGDYKPLTFKGPTDPDGSDPRPDGCKVGARYVLAWKQATATVIDEDQGLVSKMPKHPVWYLTVTAVEGGPRGPRELKDRPWVVRYTVTDIRDTDLFLKRGGGYTGFDELQAGAVPDRQWLEVRSKTIREFEIQERMKRHTERQRERDRARRSRRAA